MRTRKYVTPLEELKAKVQSALKSSNDYKHAYRLTIVNAVLQGQAPSKVSEFCGESKNTITAWVKLVDEQGLEALRGKSPPGRPSRLSDEQLESLRAVLEADPQTYGYPVWEGKTLSDYIKSKMNVKIGVRQCQNLLHKLGFTLIRPRTYPNQNGRNEQEREDFKKNSAS